MSDKLEFCAATTQERMKTEDEEKMAQENRAKEEDWERDKREKQEANVAGTDEDKRGVGAAAPDSLLPSNADWGAPPDFPPDQESLEAPVAALSLLPVQVLDRAIEKESFLQQRTLGQVLSLASHTRPGAQLSQACSDGSRDTVHCWSTTGSYTPAFAYSDTNGHAALYMAAEHNDTKTMELQLACGARMNQPSSTEAGDTPLMAAARYGSAEAVSLLLDCGVDWMQCNSNGSNAMQLAELHMQPDTAARLQAWLVEHGEESELLEFYNQRLRLAAAEGNVLELRTLLACGADIDSADEEGATALHLAAEFGREKAVELLIEKEADMEACDDTGQSALVRLHVHALAGARSSGIACGEG